jgi:1-acyl-sn-glycerol-3-phosphate acyltransferase
VGAIHPGYWFATLLLGLLILGRLLLRYLERYAGADWGKRWYNSLDGLTRLLCHRYHRLNRLRLPLPESGPAIVVANHISGLDPLLLVASASRPLRFIIAAEQYRRFGLTWLFRAAGCIPVDRDRNPQRAFRAALQALEEGEVVALFPHGKIHLDSDPPRKLKAGAIKLAQLAKCPVLPVRIDGVAGAGTILQAVWRRSHACIEAHEPLHCYDESTELCSRHIAESIERREQLPPT